MKGLFFLGCACALLFTAGCTTHMVFMEESHAGLKVRVGGNTPSPYEISLGYRRGMVAAVPKQLQSNSEVSAEGGNGEEGNVDGKKVVLKYDPKELMSLYTEFCANVGFNDPVEFHHLLVTGDAAIWLLAADNSEIRNALGQVQVCKTPVRMGQESGSKPEGAAGNSSATAGNEEE